MNVCTLMHFSSCYPTAFCASKIDINKKYIYKNEKKKNQPVSLFVIPLSWNQ